MNYDLSQKLKEAGYPQAPISIGSKWYLADGKKTVVCDSSNQHNLALFDTRIPSLEELIEACGDAVPFFLARVFKNSILGWRWECGVGDIHCSALNPSEAVVLNKK
jgi:hypothetical protein